LENEEMSDASPGLRSCERCPKLMLVRLRRSDTLSGARSRCYWLSATQTFSGAGYSWDRSAPLRARLLEAVANVTAPIFFIHAANDFSLPAGKALDARLEQLGRPHRLKLYPPVGHTPEDGHSFLYLGMNTWELDVFAFLDEHMRR